MLDSIRLQCPKCEERFHLSLPFVKGLIRGMKQVKAQEVVHQLHDKRGPFYDKWLAAMESRGEQKRCNDCDELVEDYQGTYCLSSDDICLSRNPGLFACAKFKPKWTD